MAAAELDAYFREAASWDVDRSAQTVSRLRIVWTVAVAGWVCSLCLCATISIMMPLKSVEPFVIRVDNSTGIVDIVPMYAGRAELPEVTTRWALTRYITLCEGYNFVSVERDYEECGAFHTLKRNQDWAAQWNRVNPQSPLNLYKDGSSIEAKVTAITFFTKANGITSLAQVRYLKIKTPPGGGVPSSTHWIATIEYAYAAPSKDARTRQWNPLGFKIVDFQTVAEAAADANTLPDPTHKGRTP